MSEVQRLKNLWDERKHIKQLRKAETRLALIEVSKAIQAELGKRFEVSIDLDLKGHIKDRETQHTMVVSKEFFMYLNKTNFSQTLAEVKAEIISKGETNAK